MNANSPIGHNNPPDPIDTWLAEHADTLSEAESWLDGEAIETEGQMKSVDVLIKGMRTAGTSLGAYKKDATAPLHDIWKAEIARWKPTEDDVARIKNGLVDLVAPIKARIADEKKAAERAAYEAAREAERVARELAMKAEATDIESQREAAAALDAAQEANDAAKSASKGKVKGLRTVTHHEVVDMRALVNWIAKNDKDAMADFATEYARRHHSNIPDATVRTWTTKEPY